MNKQDGSIDVLHRPISSRLLGSYRLFGRFVKRILRIWRLFPSALHHGGGVRATSIKVYRIYRNNGLDGLRRSLLGIHAASNQPLVVLQNGQRVYRNDYQEWIRKYDTMDDDKRVRIRGCIEEIKSRPLISVVMPTFNAKLKWLSDAIASVQNQLYPHWELCIADDASTDTTIRALLERFAAEDSRIKVVFRQTNGHISLASNSALELVSGEWVALLDHDDLLSEDALFWVAKLVDSRPNVRMVYSDEDKIDENGVRHEPYFKCDWNVDLFYSQNMFSHLGVYHSELVRSVCGFRSGLEGSQDYDLALRCIQRITPEQIAHVPRVLYHWRVHAESTANNADAKPYAKLAAACALSEHFQCMGIRAQLESSDFGYRVRYELPCPCPLVSLLIALCDCKDDLEATVCSILDMTTYGNYEVVIIDSGSVGAGKIDWIHHIRQKDKRVRVIEYYQQFSYPAAYNFGVNLAKGSIIGLINNTVEVISPDWLSEMVTHASRADIGCVGAKLYFPDDTIARGGVVLGLGGVVGTSEKNLLKGAYGYFGRAVLQQNYSAVTGECLLIRKEIFKAVGGFNEEDLDFALYDVDFCLKVREAGYRNLWTPYAELYLHKPNRPEAISTPEKRSRFLQEINYMKKKWGENLLRDPCYSPNLTLDYEDFSLAWPPRVELT